MDGKPLLSEEVLMHVTHQVLQVVHHLSAAKHCHRDWKLDNVMASLSFGVVGWDPGCLVTDS